MNQLVSPGAVCGRLRPPADKSISHRALLLAALATGTSHISNLLLADDILSTWRCLVDLGVRIERQDDVVAVTGNAGRLAQPRRPLYLGNSGTTLRLLSGLLAAQPLWAVLTGDQSLNRRPLQRVLRPLRLMGGKSYATPAGTAPVLILGQRLRGITYTLPVASAQLKSALLLAGLQANGETVIIDQVPSRDHSERMLASMGASLVRQGDSIVLSGPQMLHSRNLCVPGDFSSAAPFIAAAVISADSRLLVEQVGLNPTRTGLLGVLQRMGAQVNVRLAGCTDAEPWGELQVVGGAKLCATEVTAAEIPLLIDEVPLLAVVACCAAGTTVINGIAELRVKESDRIESIVQPLRQLGAEIVVHGDSLHIRGQNQPFRGGQTLATACDHRIAMALAVAATRATAPVEIAGAEWVGISYPGFFEQLTSLQEAARCAF